MERWLPLLAKTQLFAGLQAEQISALLPCLQIHSRQFDKGDLICLAGSGQDVVGLVLAGSVVVQKEDQAGNRTVIDVLAAGDLFGEVGAFAGDGRWPGTVLAASSGEVMFIPTGRITEQCCQACVHHQSIVRNMLQVLAGKAMSMNRQISFMKRKGMREKLAAYLLDQYRQSGSKTFHTSTNREALADYLGVSRPSMSRELGRLKADGLIDYLKSSYTVLDPDRLQQAVR